MATYVAQLRRFSRNARLFLLAAALTGLSNSTLMLFFNLYVLSLGYGKDFLGLLQALPATAGLVAALPAGLWADRFGRKPALILGSAISGLGGLLFLLARAPLPMALAMAGAGLGGTLFVINIEPFLSESASDEERTALFSVHAGLITLTGFAGNLIAGLVPGLLGGWLGAAPQSAQAYRATLFAGGVVALVGFVPLLFIREGMERGADLNRTRINADSRRLRQEKSASIRVHPRPIGLFLREFWPSRMTLRLAVPNLLIGLGAALLIPYLNVFFTERYALPDNQLGVLFSLASVMTGLAILVGPVLAGRWGKVRSLASSQTVSVIFLLILGFVPILPVAALAFWLRTALMNLGAPLYAAFGMEQTPAGERARVNAVLALAWGAGAAVGPYTAGLCRHAGASAHCSWRRRPYISPPRRGRSSSSATPRRSVSRRPRQARRHRLGIGSQACYNRGMTRPTIPSRRSRQVLTTVLIFLLTVTLALAACTTQPPPSPAPLTPPARGALPAIPSPPFIPRQVTLVPPTLSPVPEGPEPTPTATPVFTGTLPTYFWPSYVPPLGDQAQLSGGAMGTANLRAGAKAWFLFSSQDTATSKSFSVEGGTPAQRLLYDFPQGQTGETVDDVTVRGHAAKLYRLTEGTTTREWLTFEEEGLPVLVSGVQLDQGELQKAAEALQPVKPDEFRTKLDEAGVYIQPTITAEVQADKVTIDVRGINWPPGEPVRLVVVPVGTKQVQNFAASVMPNPTGDFRTTLRWEPGPNLEVLAVSGNDVYRAIARLPNP